MRISCKDDDKGKKVPYLGSEWSEVMRKQAMTARFRWLDTQLLQTLFSLLEVWSIWSVEKGERIRVKSEDDEEDERQLVGEGD